MSTSSTSSTPSTSRTSSRVTREPDGETPDGTLAEVWRFANPGGVSLRVTTYGGIIMSLMAPDRDGHVRHGVLENQVTDDNPCHDLAEGGVGVGVLAAGDWDQ